MINVKPQRPKSMDAKAIVGAYKTTTVTHYDGNTRNICYNDIEVEFTGDEKISSCTTPEGVITIVNSVFVRMSGYSKKELIGMPHYILHHPDMPRAAFKAMWASLKANGRWEGYVKNLRKDGAFYWVYATVFSNFRNGQLVGYTSSRRAITAEEKQECEAKYKLLLAKETARRIA